MLRSSLRASSRCPFGVGNRPPSKLLFGSDFPWLDPRANLGRILQAQVPSSARRRILRDNALEAYQLDLQHLRPAGDPVSGIASS